MSALGTQVQPVARRKMSVAMLRFAEDRRCSTCSKKAALIVVGFDSAGKRYRCRYCGVEMRLQA